MKKFGIKNPWKFLRNFPNFKFFSNVFFGVFSTFIQLNGKSASIQSCPWIFVVFSRHFIPKGKILGASKMIHAILSNKISSTICFCIGLCVQMCFCVCDLCILCVLMFSVQAPQVVYFHMFIYSKLMLFSK